MGSTLIDQVGGRRIRADQLFEGQEVTLPPLSSAGEYRIAMDAADNLLKASVNGGAYTAFPGLLVGNTLDQSYDQGGPGAGRTIIADAGAVEIQTPTIETVALESQGVIRIDATSLEITDDGGLAALSAPNEGRLIYNQAAGSFQVSTNGGAYINILTGGALPDLQVAYNGGSLIDLNVGEGAVDITNTTAVADELLNLTQDAGVANTTMVVAAGLGLAAEFNLGSISVPDTGANSERFGLGASAAFDDTLAVGNTAVAGAINATAIGSNATASDAGALALGQGVIASGANSISVGTASTATGDRSISIGDSANAGFDDSIAIGRGAATTVPNQMVIGALGSEINIFRVVGDTAASLGTVHEFTDGSAQGVSVANEGRLIYNAVTQTFQVSMNTGAYLDIATGGSLSLQSAYDAGGAGLGRTIDISGAALPVAITNTTPFVSALLTIAQDAADATIPFTVAAGGAAVAAQFTGAPTDCDGGAATDTVTIGPEAGPPSVAVLSDNSIAIGLSAVVGDGANASTDAVAIGSGATVGATGGASFAIAIGSAIAESPSAVAIGSVAFIDILSDGSIAIGNAAIGNGTDLTTNCIAIGQANVSTVAGLASERAVGIGDQCTVGTTASATGSIAIGSTSNVQDVSAIAIGESATVLNGAVAAIAVGTAAVAGGLRSVAVGLGASSTADESVCVGDGAAITAGPERSVAIGNGALIGNGANASVGSIAIGDGATSSTHGSVAAGTISIGDGALASTAANAPGAISIGSGSSCQGAQGVAVGVGATSGATRNIAVGEGALATAGGLQTIAIGFDAVVGNAVLNNTGSICIGSGCDVGTTAVSARTVVVGYLSSCQADEGISIGDGSLIPSGAAQGISIGNTAQIGNAAQVSTGCVAIGNSAAASTHASEATNTIAIGNSAAAGSTANSPNAIAIGNVASAQAVRAISIGNLATCGSQEGIAIGDAASISTTATGCIAIGDAATCTTAGVRACVAIGVVATCTTGEGNIAIGDGAQSLNNSGGSIAIGDNAVCSAGAFIGSIALGENTQAQSSEQVCIGISATATTTQSVAIGSNSITFGGGGVAIGYQAAARGTSSTAVGSQCIISNNNNNNTLIGALVANTATAGAALDNVVVGSGTTVVRGQNVLVGSRINTGHAGNTDLIDAIGIGAEVTFAALATTGRSNQTILIGRLAHFAADVSSVGAIGIGFGQTINGDRSISLGYISAGAGGARAAEAICIGDDALVATGGTAAIAIGNGATVGAHASAIALGDGAATSAANQCVLGAAGAAGILVLRLPGNAAASAGTVIEMTDASDVGVAVSAANEGRIRYNAATQTFQVSLNTAAYVSLSTGAGGGTLDNAYDFGGAGAGRTIQADSGAVEILNTAAAANVLLQATQAANVANATALFSHNGLGSCVSVNQNAAGIASGVDVNNTSATNTGIGVSVIHSGSGGSAGSFQKAGTGGNAVEVSVSNAANAGLLVSSTHAGTGNGIFSHVTNAASAGRPFFATTDGIGTAYYASLSNAANASAGLLVEHSGTGAGIRLSGADTSCYIELDDGQNAAVSAANEGRIRYNAATQTFQVSLNTAAYVSLSTGAGGGTLDNAYDFGGAGAGRTITADTGAVLINNAVADATNGLEVNRTNATGDGVAILVTGNIHSSGTAGNDSLRIGFGSNATSNQAIAIGHDALADANQAIAIGDVADAGGNQAIAIGDGADAGGNSSVAIGKAAVAAHQSICLGDGASSSANNQCVIGGSGTLVNHLRIGSGVTSATPPASISIQGTTGTGTDIDGSDVLILGGQSTGTGLGGLISLETALPDGVSGTGTNALTTFMQIDPSLQGNTGAVTFLDRVVMRPQLLDYSEKVNIRGTINGNPQNLDLELGNVASATINGATTFVFQNPASAGQSSSLTLILTNGGSAAVVWPGSVDWPGGVAPTLTAAGVDVLTFFTTDAGTTWYGVLAIADAQ